MSTRRGRSRPINRTGKPVRTVEEIRTFFESKGMTIEAWISRAIENGLPSMLVRMRMGDICGCEISEPSFDKYWDAAANSPLPDPAKFRLKAGMWTKRLLRFPKRTERLYPELTMFSDTLGLIEKGAQPIDPVPLGLHPDFKVVGWPGVYFTFEHNSERKEAFLATRKASMRFLPSSKPIRSGYLLIEKAEQPDAPRGGELSRFACDKWRRIDERGRITAVCVRDGERPVKGPWVAHWDEFIEAVKGISNFPLSQVVDPWASRLMMGAETIAVIDANSDIGAYCGSTRDKSAVLCASAWFALMGFPSARTPYAELRKRRDNNGWKLETTTLTLGDLRIATRNE